MSKEQDQRFFDLFFIVLGLLIAVAVGLIVLAGDIGGDQQTEANINDPAYQAAVLERIAPVGRVAITGQEFEEESAPEVEIPAQAKEVLTGPQVYNAICGSCHGTGLAGAPATGDKAAWAPRIAQGAATMNKNAIDGFQGATGFMPPKGGRMDLSDEEIIAAVDYLVQELQ
ncbi:MAG: c-type cytochrome [Gammaproteobacteria bacterium]